MKVLVFLFDLNQIWIFWTDFNLSPQCQNSPNSFQWEQSWCTQTDRRTDGHDEANRRLSLLTRTSLKYKVVQIWPEQTVTCLHTINPGHIWTTLYKICSERAAVSSLCIHTLLSAVENCWVTNWFCLHRCRPTKHFVLLSKAWKYLRLHVKYPIFLSNFDETGCSRETQKKTISNLMQIVPCEPKRTDRHRIPKLVGTFRGLWERACYLCRA